MRVLFIGGLGRSGSTVLERLLGELPGVFSAGEVVHLWQRGLVDDECCGCGAAFHACPFWTKVGKTAFGGWDALDVDALAARKHAVDRTRFVPALARRRPGADLRRRVNVYTDLYRALYEAVAEVSACRVVVDSSKHMSLAYCLRWCDEIDLRVLHVVRDARAVAYSWSKTVARPEATEGSAEGAYMARWGPAKAAVQWSAHNVGFDLLARRGVPTMRVRYEDFVRSPASTLRAVAEHAGVEADPLPVRGMSATLAPGHQVAGNPMRFRSGAIEIRSDETWRGALSAPRRTLVTGLALPLLARYGYLTRRGRSA